MKIHRVLLTTIALTGALLLVPSFGFAQNDRPYQGYLFGSTGTSSLGSGAQIGGGIGFERLSYLGIGGGADIQLFGVTQRYDPVAGFLLTANGSYHFRRQLSEGKLSPFVTGGYSGIAACGGGCGGANGFNAGGGVNYWIKPNRGLRIEVRDHAFSHDFRDNMVEFRIGFAF